MSIGDLVVHDDGVRSGRVEGVRRTYNGRLWLRVRLDNGEIAARPMEEWHKAEGRYS